MNFSDVKGGEEMRSWFADALPAMQNGVGVTFVGSGALAHDHLMLTARGCYKKGLTTKVLHLIRLTSILEDDDLWDCALKPKALFVIGFQDQRNSPLTEAQTRWVEDMLTARMDSGKVNNIWVQIKVGSAGRAPSLTWWSPDLASLIFARNEFKSIGDDK